MANSKTGGSRHSKREVPLQRRRAIVGRDRLSWRSENNHLCLYHRSDGKPLVVVEPDSRYAGMYRIRHPNGDLSDMVNLTRAKDAACWFALRSLNSPPQETCLEGSQARKKVEAVGNIGQSANRARCPHHGLLAGDRP